MAPWTIALGLRGGRNRHNPRDGRAPFLDDIENNNASDNPRHCRAIHQRGAI